MAESASIGARIVPDEIRVIRNDDNLPDANSIRAGISELQEPEVPTSDRY